MCMCVCVCLCVCVCVCVCVKDAGRCLGCSLGVPKTRTTEGRIFFKKGEKGTFYYLFITRFYGFTLSAIKPQ